MMLDGAGSSTLVRRGRDGVVVPDIREASRNDLSSHSLDWVRTGDPGIISHRRVPRVPDGGLSWAGSGVVRVSPTGCTAGRVRARPPLSSLSWTSLVAPTSQAGRGAWPGGRRPPTRLVLRPVSPGRPPPNIKAGRGPAQDGFGAGLEVVAAAPWTSR